MAFPRPKTTLPVITLIEVEPGVFELPETQIQKHEPVYIKIDHDFGKAGKALFDLYMDKPGAREQAITDLLTMFFK